MKTNIIKNNLGLILITFLTMTLAGCGGSDSSSTPSSNSAPIAVTGTDQNISTGSLVSLDGSSSTDADFDSLTYSWTIIAFPDGSSATLSDPTAVNPTFTADIDGIYEVILWVHDGSESSLTGDTVIITASSLNSAPVANAGADQHVQTGSTVYLDGGASTDDEGDSLTYAWTLIDAPMGSTAILDPSNLITPQFTANVDGIYIIALIVNDGTVDSVEDIVTVTAATSNSIPVANAGTDQSVYTGNLVGLDGSASSDADLDALTYTWTITSKPIGSNATLSSTTAANPTFTADLDGAYVFTLVVNDGTDDSLSDSVTVNASPLVDTFSFQFTKYTEAGTDPWIPGFHNPATAWTTIALAYSGNQFVLGVLEVIPGTYTWANGDAKANFADNAGNSYALEGSGVTSATITIDEFGDVGGRIKGTYTVTLCLTTDVCNVGTSKLYTGSFDVTREPDL